MSSQKSQYDGSPVVSSNGWTFSEDRQITKHVLEESKEDVRSASISLRGLKWKLNIPGRSEKDAKDRWRLLSKKASETRTLFEMASEVSRKLKDETFRSKLKQLEANEHPDFPPKPRTAKSLFIQARLRILERKNPGVRQDQAAQMKILGGKFKDITDEKKTKYSRLAMREKLSYEERKEEFFAAHPEYKSVKARKSNVDAAPEKPKTPKKKKKKSGVTAAD